MSLRRCGAAKVDVHRACVCSLAANLNNWEATYCSCCVGLMYKLFSDETGTTSCLALEVRAHSRHRGRMAGEKAVDKGECSNTHSALVPHGERPVSFATLCQYTEVFGCGLQMIALIPLRALFSSEQNLSFVNRCARSRQGERDVQFCT